MKVRFALLVHISFQIIKQSSKEYSILWVIPWPYFKIFSGIAMACFFKDGWSLKECGTIANLEARLEAIN